MFNVEFNLLIFFLGLMINFPMLLKSFVLPLVIFLGLNSNILFDDLFFSGVLSLGLRTHGSSSGGSSS